MIGLNEEGPRPCGTQLALTHDKARELLYARMFGQKVLDTGSGAVSR